MLNPKSSSKLNKNASHSNELTSGGAQYFSFRNRKESKYAAGFGRLQVCPSSITNADFGSYFSKDVSFMSLYAELTKKDRTKTGLTMDDIFDAIPGVQVREFLPDTKLDQCINFFGDMLQSVKDLWSSNKDKEKQQGKDGKQLQEKSSEGKGFLSKMQDVLWHAFDYMTGVAKPNNLFLKDNVPKFKGNANGVYGDGTSSIDTYMLTFPYTLYYRLQSCVTTNVYELPCKTNDDMLYSSNGVKGWTGGSNSIGIGNSFVSKIPIIGGILNNILGNVQINFMPWWNAQSGAMTESPEVGIKFYLFNDTAEAAMTNFIFVNTLVPNNMWVQYNMFQHSPCLYDVKIEGYNRLFACAATTSVKSVGVLRSPPPGWIDALCSKHGNTGGKKDGNVNASTLAELVKAARLVKIPDVYEVEMKFTSLLPQNFNNFLFTYS